MFLDRC